MPALNHILGQVRAFYNFSRLTDAHRSEQVRNPFYTLHSTIPAGIQAGRPRSQFSSLVLRSSFFVFRPSFFVLRISSFVFRFSFHIRGRIEAATDMIYFFISLMITCMSAVDILPSPLRSYFMFCEA